MTNLSLFTATALPAGFLSTKTSRNCTNDEAALTHKGIHIVALGHTCEMMNLLRGKVKK